MIRAVFFANILYLILGFLAALVGGFLYGTLTVLQAGPAHAQETLQSLLEDPGFGYVVLGSIVFAEVWAGAVAGWMVKENMLVAGLFSNLLPFLGALLRSWALSYLGPNYHPHYQFSLPPIAPFLTGYAAPCLVRSTVSSRPVPAFASSSAGLPCW